VVDVGVISPLPPLPHTLPPPLPVVAAIVGDIEAARISTVYFVFVCRLDRLLFLCVWT
jgi:hypothetical protein